MKIFDFLKKEIKFPKLYRPWQLYILILMGLIVLGYWFIKSKPYNPAGVTPPVKKDAQVELRFKKVEIRGRKEGRAYWIIQSNEVDVSKPDQRFVYFKKKNRGSFYNLKDWSKPMDSTGSPTKDEETGDGTPPERLRTFTWKADYAEYDTSEENLTLRNNVRIVTDDKDIITTDVLRWLNKEEKVYCDSKTKIVDHKGTPVIVADKVIGDVKLDVLDLKGNVLIINTVNSME